MQKLKVKDKVIVLAGKEKGKSGEISKINFKKSLVYVVGINMVKKAIKPSQENPSGGIVDIEAPLHISNIAIMSPKTNKATRIKVKEVDGQKKRVAIKCGTVLD